MLNSNQWLHRHDQFVTQSQALLHRLHECVTHLEMIADDEDAIACLQATLLSLTEQAAGASLDAMAAFTLQLQQRLARLIDSHGLSLEAIATLRHCLGLLAWQLELIDPHTGELPLDDDDQHRLLARLGDQAATATPPGVSQRD
ncbi:hypothetical protein ASF84_08825 [Pseudomonas sp. Leaf127]|uniref:hypothetical protein n=1 Tax=Pseudomonas sp. Leaf127 TaxID=1736267 RepID=UPI000702DC36|nr:hypothetical protein [Pseudomonas sp. Leaf127]KQQ57245.1 hypothetical protein ASF84_08825 [Pseudomonas sp. Leaf127]